MLKGATSPVADSRDTSRHRWHSIHHPRHGEGQSAQSLGFQAVGEIVVIGVTVVIVMIVVIVVNVAIAADVTNAATVEFAELLSLGLMVVGVVKRA